LGGFRFAELFDAAHLMRLDRQFLDALRDEAPELFDRLQSYRDAPDEVPASAASGLLVGLAAHLERFIARLFGIEAELAASKTATRSHDPVMAFKKEFVLRRARRYRGDIAESFRDLDAWLRTQTMWSEGQDAELAVALFAERLLADQERSAQAIERLTQWCALALKDPAGQTAVANWTSFRAPQKVDHARLVPLQPVADDPVQRLEAEPARRRQRDGFALTDPRMSARQVQDQVHYCIYCHEHDGDFCSKGFPEKKGQPDLGLKVDPLGVTLTGCPLEEKISEMHLLKRQGSTLGALAMVMADNPMVPATGHRICNDCMKACVYQKQEPVNIPQVETRVLTDVLNLPWGVEIYDLLTRWNPLRPRQYVMKPYDGRRVLVAGMGPAGFTMAHHLTMEGCAVVGIDGLKIEPLPERLLHRPIKHWSELEEALDERVLLGFGGVAEYGITVRWDKNFLKLIYLTLLRRPTFQAFGGVRLGGTVTVEDAWELGFDHLCVATGAGLPRIIPMGNSLARGMRQASDFLMALQLTGAAKETSLATLQVRMPAVVIGGGLTAIDTATEVQAYYVEQVEKFLHRVEELGLDQASAGLTDEDQEIFDEFLRHGRAVRAERRRAAQAGEAPDFLPLLRSWGGVTLAYRKGINASPAYQRNHEEIIKATEEGIYYAEGLDPLRAELDKYGHIEAIVFRRMESEQGRWLATRQEVTLPARSVFVAAGAVPNTIYEQEHPGTFELEGDHFLPHVKHADGLQPVKVADHCKAPEFGPFTSYRQREHCVTFLGDTHPVFHGSVVKAIASARRSYPQVLSCLARMPAREASWAEYTAFRDRIRELLSAQVSEVRLDNPAVAEVWVRAPMAARKFRPGQFYRLQTFEALTPVVHGTRLQIPVMAVSGAGVSQDRVRLMLLQWGAAPRLASRLKPGDAVILMGPTGTPAHIPERSTVMVIAGRWGAAVMLDIGPALRAAGNRVLYVATLTGAQELDRQEELEAAADQIIWCTGSEPAIRPRRPQDLSVVATDIVGVIGRYGHGELKGHFADAIRLHEVQHALIMGSTALLRGFQQAFAGPSLKPHFPADVQIVGTVGSPMQCMLKGVCAQCLQWQVDPETGARTRAVFSCAQQDQPLAWIDLGNLKARQEQNRLLEGINALWLSHVLRQAP
jgi:NADPH-dependent glutamate synthase beta subunit-like oxidoreductase/NAD(P)H-flavin reductase